MQISSTVIRVSAFRSLRTILIAAIAILSALQIFAFGQDSIGSGCRPAWTKIGTEAS